jgi:stearoyl-CoA desaturase (delta-9 desaturase)
MLATTAGAHRLWSHRAYKAKRVMSVILMLFHTMAFQVDYFFDIRDNCDKIILLVNHQTPVQIMGVFCFEHYPTS